MRPPDFSRDDYDILVDQATAGCESSMADLKRILKRNPGLRDLLGDLNCHIRRHLIELASGAAIGLRESMEQVLDKKRQELLQSGDSLPELLLIDLVLSTMLDAAVCQLA